jgi:hypothetical protein
LLATADGAAAAAGGSGWVRASVIQRHQLLAVHGRGGPCATAFVHAGKQSRNSNALCGRLYCFHLFVCAFGINRVAVDHSL